MDELAYRFRLDYCVKWILANNFKRVLVQLDNHNLRHGPIISKYLTDKLGCSEKQPDNHVDIYLSHSSSCSIDFIVSQHITGIDSIIHLGQVCISKPIIKNQDYEPEVLLVFDRLRQDSQFSNAISKLVQELKNYRSKNPGNRVCILYDTQFVDIILSLKEKIKGESLDEFTEIARLKRPSTNWHVSEDHLDLLVDEQQASQHHFSWFLTDEPIEKYQLAVYVGNKQSTELKLRLPIDLALLKIPHHDDEQTALDFEFININKLLNKRIAVVQRVKDEEELKIGVVITNPLPDIKQSMDRLYEYAKPRRHSLYFITMVQTIDECKIGNFDLCDAFVVINSCICSARMEALVFNRPILSELEFKLACGFEVTYGRVLWPGENSHPSPEDMMNRMRVSDVSLALRHTRNELLEQCSQARLNKWSGLSFNKEDGDTEPGNSDENPSEILTIQQGLEGLASSYASEPGNNRAS